MEKPGKLNNILEKITSTDTRYKVDAYFFVLEALNHTVASLPKPRHLAAGELLEGIRKYAIDQYGPMSLTVIEDWGVRNTDDFGKIVFKLIEVGLLSKTEDDKLEDFKDVYSFQEAFKSDYRYQIDN